MQKPKKRRFSTAELQKNHYVEDVIADVKADFENRRKMRSSLERQWELNLNFIAGNQYCYVNGRGEIATEDKQFYWQNKRVFNHVAPIIETRLAKLSRITPTINVRPKTDDDNDVDASDVAQKFMEGLFKRIGLEGVIKKATTWSENCGTAFYKITWNNQGGNLLGSLDGVPVKEGDVEVIALSPFEIFPDSLYVESIDDCKSIIHARALPVSKVKEIYGAIIPGADVDVFGLEKANSEDAFRQTDSKGVLPDAVVVIERYEKPSTDFPLGRLVTVAGNKLLYCGDLPYINGTSGERCFPFVKQVAIPVSGEFFGKSIVERIIPVQRAFNAVKNRKHEFLSRLSTGVMTVEDGSVDTDDLAEEGLSPGKVVVYRQGTKPPEMMQMNGIPAEFTQEEDKLLNEFVIVSGVSDVLSSTSNATVSSGTALEILIEQDNERMLTSAECIRNCYLEIAKHVLRLYAQFGSGLRAVNYQDRLGKTKIVYTDASKIPCDDVYLNSENELLSTHRQKKEMMLKLHQSGLLLDEDGKIRASTKEKMLELLGYKDLDYRKGISRLQEEKAQLENDKIRRYGMQVEEIDDHLIHVDEHTRYILSEYVSLTDIEKQRLFAHVKEHKDKINDKNRENNQ